MPKPTLSLQQSDKKDGGFYRLVSPPMTYLEYIKQLAWRTLRFPYSVYQTIVGRLLSYLVINPLFRKEEKDDSLILQHPKHPDPLFTKEDEMLVIDAYPKKHLLIRIVLNWHNFLVNHMTTMKIASAFLRSVVNLLPSGTHYIEDYLNEITDKVADALAGKKGTALSTRQIHFRGIEKLKEEHQELLFQKLEQRFHYNFRENRNRVYFYTLQTTDNAILDSVEIRPPHTMEQDIKNRHFIVTAMPRSNNYVDWLKHYQVYAKELNATLIAFNYRGVGSFSRGLTASEEDLYYDAYSQVQRLIKLGVKPENIATMGECLGGNVATHTAAKLQEEGLPVKLFSARSFRSLTSILEGRSKPEVGASLASPKTWLQWLIYGAVKFIFNPIIRSAGWSLNIDQHFTRIPPHDRDFIVTRSKSADRFADDLMVPHKQASTYSLVKEQFKQIQAKQDHGEVLSATEKEWLADSPNQHKFHVSEELHNKARKANGHTVHPRLLVTTYPRPDGSNINGREYILNFFRHVWPKEEQNVSVLEAIEPIEAHC